MPYQLPADSFEGFTTPTADRTPQKISVPPKRVIPIVFLPGVMGSNLKMSEKRRGELKKANNMAWRPDNKTYSMSLLFADAATRQRRLDPDTTEVDVYDPRKNKLTDDGTETMDDRHSNVRTQVDYGLELPLDLTTPLLMDDPIKSSGSRTRDQKARERGWGEVYFGSYGKVLQLCEERLNTAFFGGKLDSRWLDVVGVDPAHWQAVPASGMKALTEEELKVAVKGCWFPVHAMGYNWLKSNRQSGEYVAERIKKLIESYKRKYDCEKVIVVTHSMGGLTARALIHPDMGNLQDKVLGMVHSVMPANGAATGYKRIRSGFEDVALDPRPKVPGNLGDEVTAVLANAPGGLQLLPNIAYGNDWLKIVRGGKTVKSLPQHGDPYEEIYKVRGKWYGLLNEEWINPAKVKNEGAGFPRTCKYLDTAKAFHGDIASTYHPVSYAHYGADPANPAWQTVVWDVADDPAAPDIETALVSSDDRQGKLMIASPGAVEAAMAPLQAFPEALSSPTVLTPGVRVTLRPAADPGDQTVPVHSADQQLRSGKFRGIFRQTGYDHQGSYENDKVLTSTLYCLVRIAQEMTWGRA